ncbi:uncharacterized protein STEHIDRAFT_148001 [Stereum hirsutum FP-91666 SS1]|uniref:uncharacterized protein n=1 Tax=Stereum hirsutum (strain FP-91666) TaxID=721885 RepID=UPI000444A397|nr:uncharacterized protein STEHIDRAFT_148001 [Stereum hirsutum FP-91666 SS1]EIM85686.1 hypothetical protein STEHIDRAFT_148001 [Stereum hirsutum FP-91666 SS1]
MSEKDQLSILRQYDTVILLDDSGSMADYGRWEEAKKALSDLAAVAGKYDTDGIEICFINSMKHGKHIKLAKDVESLLGSMRPNGLTFIGERLEEILRQYSDSLDNILGNRLGNMEQARLQRIKPINIIIITDGIPSDEPQECIDFFAREFDRKKYPLTQVGIQFVQIGNDKGATEYLEKLDGDLQKLKEHRDMVDTTPYKPKKGKLSEERLRKIMLGGILRRIDRQHQIEVGGTKGRRMGARDLEGFAAW